MKKIKIKNSFRFRCTEPKLLDKIKFNKEGSFSIWENHRFLLLKLKISDILVLAKGEENDSRSHYQ